MPQKKLQLKTVAANMCGLQPVNSGLIQFVKQQSQSIAVSYTLAFLFNKLDQARITRQIKLSVRNMSARQWIEIDSYIENC